MKEIKEKRIDLVRRCEKEDLRKQSRKEECIGEEEGNEKRVRLTEREKICVLRKIYQKFDL